MVALVAAVYAAETGVALKADDIKAEPFKDAKTLASLAKGDTVEILGKQGGWLQVKAAKGKGWVRILSVKRGSTSKKDAGKEASGVLAMSTGRAGTGQIVSATGVRGLSEEDLKAAKFDEAELKKAEANAIILAAAASFAAQGKLAAREVAFLPEPRQSAQGDAPRSGRQ
jgi:hypothetical protein